MAREGVVVVGDGNEFLKTDLAARIDEVIDSEVRVQGVGMKLIRITSWMFRRTRSLGRLMRGVGTHHAVTGSDDGAGGDCGVCRGTWVSESGGLISTQ